MQKLPRVIFFIKQKRAFGAGAVLWKFIMPSPERLAAVLKKAAYWKAKYELELKRRIKAESRLKELERLYDVH